MTSTNGLVVLGILLLTLPVAVAQKTFDSEQAFPAFGQFFQPTDIQAVPDGSNRIAVVEQNGRIRLIEDSPEANSVEVLLDIRDQVDMSPSWEEGLLGLAFHPNYAQNGRFYVHYTAHPIEPEGQHRTIVARFTHDHESEVDPETEEVLIEFDQPQEWHNGGQLTFGPPEGPDGRRFLYIALGDGGGAWDPFNHAQDLTTLLGTVLRIDVEESGDELLYAIPDDNPFAGNDEGWREEIWAYGLRNPWRFSFDFETDRLWLGDVGQNRMEEINLIVPGGNYGWPAKEGTLCGRPPEPGETECDDPSLVDPVWEYGRAEGNSVTGGHVYRGAKLPDLVGRYVYGDFVSGRVWALDVNDDETQIHNELLFQSTGTITTFGVAPDGELLFAARTGQIHRLIAGELSTDDGPTAVSSATIRLAGPNPVKSGTTLEVAAQPDHRVRISLADILGREVAVLHESAGIPGGRLEVPVRTAGLAAGVYLARLEIDGRPVDSVRLTVIP